MAAQLSFWNRIHFFERLITKVETTRTVTLPVVGHLSKPLAFFVRGHGKALGIVSLLLLAGALAFVCGTRKALPVITTDKVSRGSIEVDVSATGTVQAVTTVQVGSQVPGSVAWLGADFKSSVKRGQIVAKLDPALFQAQVDTARANVLNAQAGVQAAMTEIQNQTANVEAAKANDRASAAARDDAISIAKQNEKLKGVIPDRDIEAAENASKAAIARYSQATSQIGQAQAQLQISQAKLKQAQAGVSQAQAQLEQATVNLEHTVISSPIDGVVVSRSVDVGQTVAASLSAPTLFTIANDLTNMQVLASIDEADVGQVREGLKAHFAVDAFPGQIFYGDLAQVRLNAQTLQNVVTYTAVINVANPDQKLMPGMTANITIPVARRDDVLRVPNATLRFKAELTDQQQKIYRQRSMHFASNSHRPVTRQNQRRCSRSQATFKINQQPLPVLAPMPRVVTQETAVATQAGTQLTTRSRVPTPLPAPGNVATSHLERKGKPRPRQTGIRTRIVILLRSHPDISGRTEKREASRGRRTTAMHHLIKGMVQATEQQQLRTARRRRVQNQRQVRLSRRRQVAIKTQLAVVAAVAGRVK
jgi:HlyD family secretion protein